MSSIVVKAFDATQKILRAIFHGSPNLITTSDLNRQIEAFDYRLRQLEWFRGIDTDLHYEDGVVTSQVTLAYTYIRIFGCTLYQGAKVTLNLETDNNGTIFLYATPGIVTYSDDASHAISGAKFADGTSRPAADHQVISSWGIRFTATEFAYTPNKPLYAGTDISITGVPSGSIVIPLWRITTDDGTQVYRQFEKGLNLLDMARFFNPRSESLSDDEGGYYIEDVFGKVSFNPWLSIINVNKDEYVQASGTSEGLFTVYSGWFPISRNFKGLPSEVPMAVRFYLNGEEIQVCHVLYACCSIESGGSEHPGVERFAFTVRFMIPLQNQEEVRVVMSAQFVGLAGSNYAETGM